MLRSGCWRADSFRFVLGGRNAQRFFGLAAAQGCPLQDIRCTAEGFLAAAQGKDLAALQALAEKNGWTFRVVSRTGPGKHLQSLLRCPGIPAGFAAFLALVRLFSGFVWAMDLQLPDSRQEQPLRAQLAQYGIQEGARLTQEALLKAQQDLNQNSDQFGWLSLNFAGGCLFVESTPLERQPIAQAAQDTALYSKADALVLAVELDSGFALVKPGQYVARGQMLASSVRPDHDGAPVTQAAAGTIRARVEQTFTATQALSERRTVLRGDSLRYDTLSLFGYTWPLQTGLQPPRAGKTETERLPLRFGMLALPGSLCRQTVWPTEERQILYSADTAAALARRACRLALQAEYPDAAVESCETVIENGPDGVLCTARYIFVADIAVGAPYKGEPLS